MVSTAHTNFLRQALCLACFVVCLTLFSACSDCFNFPSAPIDDRFVDTVTVYVDTTGCLSCSQVVAAGEKAGNCKVLGYATVVEEVSNGQQTVWMADTENGGKVFEAYYCNLSRRDTVHLGDLIMVSGTVTIYNSTTEIKNGRISIVKRKPKLYTYFNESFTSTMGAFTVTGEPVWTIASACIQAQSKGGATESWLISPKIDLSDSRAPLLSFYHYHQAMGNEDKAALLRVMVRYDEKAWQPVEISAWSGGTLPRYTEAKDMKLTNMGGKSNVQIAFVYRSTANVQPKWCINNVTVSEMR